MGLRTLLAPIWYIILCYLNLLHFGCLVENYGNSYSIGHTIIHKNRVYVNASWSQSMMKDYGKNYPHIISGGILCSTVFSKESLVTSCQEGFQCKTSQEQVTTWCDNA